MITCTLSMHIVHAHDDVTTLCGECDCEVVAKLCDTMTMMEYMLGTHTHASLLREGRHATISKIPGLLGVHMVVDSTYIIMAHTCLTFLWYGYVRISHIHGCALSRFAPAFRMSPLHGTLRGRLQG